MSREPINYTREAFLHRGNLLFLVAGVAISLGIASVTAMPAWLPLIFVMAGELLYMGIMPRNERYRRHVRSQKIAEKNQAPSKNEIFRSLNREDQRRVKRLRDLRDEIRTNYRGLSYASQGLLDSHLKKIDGLIESYLQMLHQRERYLGQMNGASEGQVLQQIRDLKDDMADDSERVRRVKQRRMKVLKQRLARFKKGHENLEVLGAQLGTIEDVVKYIHEESWTMQNPEEISFQLDTLMEEVEETQSSVRQIEDVFSSSASDLLDDYDFEKELGGTDMNDDVLESMEDMPSTSEQEKQSGSTSASRVKE
ncbi:hypothetical protein CRI94_15980 [Longibacter salinarum]|uniref:Uncharacterized protein n=1 Tax=Longibacter salinarum TaxID=1850348 RepID=A0A2A8CTU2_9BACT|nr:hypothetical protein [Longibacter salinarum]PEN11288.1 hypothetical protein CRI94_15980 [Longibacter salinarum]